MTRNTFFAAVALVAAAAAPAAFAQEAGSDAWQQIEATKTVAQVQAELKQARASGLTKAWSAGYIEPAVAVKSRAEVLNEVAMARASGELDAINAEVFAFAPTATVNLAQAAR